MKNISQGASSVFLWSLNHSLMFRFIRFRITAFPAFLDTETPILAIPKGLLL